MALRQFDGGSFSAIAASSNQAIRSLERHLVRLIWTLGKQGRNNEMREKLEI